MATWQQFAHSAFQLGQNASEFLVKGIRSLKENKTITALAAAEPKLVPLINKLTALIPGIGTASAVLDVADWTVEHWDAVRYLGALTHFAPADAMNHVPFKEDTGDTSFTTRD